MNLLFLRVLKIMLLIFSCGFYTLPVVSFENPAHPRSPEDIVEEDRKEREKYEQAPPCDEDDPRHKHRENWVGK